MIQAQDNSLTDRAARTYRNGDGTNRTQYLSFYAGDTFSHGRLTLDLGVRYAPDAGVVAANGNGRELTNYEGYSATYNGIELSVIKRMSYRRMMRAAFAWNDPREQVNVNGAYDLGYGFEVAGNLFGRQGNPYPIFQPAALGFDGTIRVLVSPEIDTFRFDDVWNLDRRAAKTLRYDRLNLQLVADLFNVLNANTELNRQRNITNPNFGRLTQNLSPRILRFGVRIGF
jgi:hypothetical protein